MFRSDTNEALCSELKFSIQRYGLLTVTIDKDLSLYEIDRNA